jgi:hypothetical protein
VNALAKQANTESLRKSAQMNELLPFATKEAPEFRSFFRIRFGIGFWRRALGSYKSITINSNVAQVIFCP